jgi:hypothetical protein
MASPLLLKINITVALSEHGKNIVKRGRMFVQLFHRHYENKDARLFQGLTTGFFSGIVTFSHSGGSL